MKKIFLLIVGIFVTSISYGQKLSVDEINKTNSIVFESLTKENFIKMNRITSGGKLSSCELEYQYAYRDFKSQQGKPVLVVGNFSLMYFKDKNLIFTFKIVPSVGDVLTQNWTYKFPEYSDIFFNNQGIEKFKTTEFSCDPRGKCTGYSDKDLDLLKVVLSPQPFDGEVKFSLSKGGMDNTFFFSSLLTKEKSIQERRKFNVCMGEIMNQFVSDLDIKK